MASAAAGQAALILSLALASTSVAWSGERADWFKSLRMPGSKASCCDEGDCHQTEAHWRSGRWWAIVNDEWREVPQSAVLTQPFSIDGAAYVCSGTPAWTVGGDPNPKAPIYCFVPPNWPS